MGNEESLLKLGGLTFAHPEPPQHVSEDFSSYRSLLAAAFSLPIFPLSIFFFFFKFLNNTKKKEKREGGREERCLLCQLKGSHLPVVSQASLFRAAPSPPAVPGSLSEETAAGDHEQRSTRQLPNRTKAAFFQPHA